MRSRDNLKKLAFRLSPAPGMAKLESAWQEAAELAADDAAVSSVRDASGPGGGLNQALPIGSGRSCSRHQHGLAACFRIDQRSGWPACSRGMKPRSASFELALVHASVDPYDSSRYSRGLRPSAGPDAPTHRMAGPVRGLPAANSPLLHRLRFCTLPHLLSLVVTSSSL